MGREEEEEGKSKKQSLFERYLNETTGFAARFIKRFDSLRADQAQIYNAVAQKRTVNFNSGFVAAGTRILIYI